jgi:hypothetical protein
MTLWFAKTLADFEINDIAALPPRSVKTPSHASIYRPVPGNAGSLLARASEPLTRESGATSTTRRPETSESAAKLDLLDKLFWVAVSRWMKRAPRDLKREDVGWVSSMSPGR